MTVAAEPRRSVAPPTVVMHDVPWEYYVQLVELPGSAHLRMTYNRGELEIMPPLRQKPRTNWTSAPSSGSGYVPTSRAASHGVVQILHSFPAYSLRVSSNPLGSQPKSSRNLARSQVLSSWLMTTWSRLKGRSAAGTA